MFLFAVRSLHNFFVVTWMSFSLSAAFQVVNAAGRMRTARSFSNDAGFNLTVARLGDSLSVRKDPDNGAFTFSFEGGKFQLVDEEDAFEEFQPPEDGDEDDSLPTPELKEIDPFWETELISGDQVVAFEGTPLGSLSFEDLLSEADPIQKFRTGNQYALPVFGKGGGKGDGDVKGFMIAQYIELDEDQYIQIMPSNVGNREAELVAMRDEERKRRIQQQILDKQQKLQQIKTDNASYTYFEVALTKKKKMNLLFEVRINLYIIYIYIYIYTYICLITSSYMQI